MIINSVDFFKTISETSINKDAELIIIAWKIINPGNIGHIIRLAHNIGARELYFISGKNEYRESKIKKTAGFSFNQMKWKFISEEQFDSIIVPGFTTVALETCEDSTNIYSKSLPQKMVLVAGNESFGLPPDLIEQCKEKIHIPMPGACKSMNVSHALSVACFEWYRQMLKIDV